MGKFDRNKTRLLKITCANSQQVTEILRTYKVKNRQFLNRDLTAYQRNQSYLVRNEFRKRKENGENNLVLRYRHGIPKIVVRADTESNGDDKSIRDGKNQ